jgi:hypothetical protein
MNKNIILLAALAALACLSPAPAAELPSYSVMRATEKIVLDGILDEEDWKAAPSFGDFTFPWYAGGEREQTEAKMLWNDDFLYLSFTCRDKHIWADHYNTNAATYNDDAAEMFWNPDPLNQATYYQFEINCIGNLLSVWRSGASTRPVIMVPHITQNIAGSMNNDADTDSLWVLEVGIRFSDYPELLKTVPPRPGDMWRINLNRCGGKTNLQYSQWSSSSTATPNFHSPGDFGKLFFSSEPVRKPTAVDRQMEDLPATLRITAACPNPFNPATVISFFLAETGTARLEVFDITGRRVRTLVHGFLRAGGHALPWDGCDDIGRPVSSGVYLARLGMGGISATSKMTLVK